jgi:hypothetical protein
MRTQNSRWHAIAALVVVAGVAAGCDAAGNLGDSSHRTVGGDVAGPVAIQTNRDTSVVASVGQEVEITLGTVGPGQFNDPSVANGPVQFLGSAVVPPYIPSGPQQQFRFTAVQAGNMVVVFHHSQGDTYPYTPADIADTIMVR